MFQYFLLFYCPIISHCMDITTCYLSIHQSMDIWVVFDFLSIKNYAAMIIGVSALTSVKEIIILIVLIFVKNSAWHRVMFKKY